MRFVVKPQRKMEKKRSDRIQNSYGNGENILPMNNAYTILPKIYKSPLTEFVHDASSK